jgi:hypothetical protein
VELAASLIFHLYQRRVADDPLDAGAAQLGARHWQGSGEGAWHVRPQLTALARLTDLP